MDNENWLMQQAEAISDEYESMQPETKDFIESHSASSANLKEEG